MSHYYGTPEDQHEIVEVMADEADSGYAEETTEPSMDSAGSAAEETDESNAVVFKLHEEIDNLNLVLDYLERKNGDIYSRMKMLLTSFQQNEPTQDE